MALAKKLIERNEELKAQKLVWEDHWEELAELIMPRKSNIKSTFERGEYLNDDIFDSTAIRASRTMASALIGMLWPSGSKSFRLNPPKSIDQTKENKEYYDRVSEIMANAMDNPKSGLPVALDEYMQDQAVFGTSGIAIFPSEEEGSDIVYQPWNIKEMSIDEGQNGFVNTVYYEFEWPIRKVIEKYGIENVSQVLREKASNGKADDMVKILHVIQPKKQLMEFFGRAKGNQGMAFSSIHLEIQTKKILLQKGFDEMPIKVTRFRKGSGEIYGRSPGIDALPDIREVNFIWQSLTVAIEKSLDPPLALISDGKLGGGTLDTSPGAFNVFKPTGRLGVDNPIVQLPTNGELQSTSQLIEELRQSITEHFFIDKLLDFNNTTQMTLGEAQIRNTLRNDALRSIFARQTAELFVPLVERTFNLLLKMGKLGFSQNSQEAQDALLEGKNVLIIPDDVAEMMAAGEDVFEITFITPAERLLRSREAEGIVRLWEFALQIAPVQPEILDNLNADISLRELGSILGAPNEILNDEDQVTINRDIRLQAAIQQQQAEQLQQGVATAAEANKAGLLGEPNA